MAPSRSHGTVMKPYFAYIRVSTAKQGKEGTSLDEQKEAIERYVERNGLTITRWYQEVETAAKRGRPVFTQLMKALQQHRADGVILHKIDRGARNLKDWANLGELIDLGLDVRFAHENLDVHSRGGRLAADIQAVVAADYIRNLREEVKKGFYGRLKQGAYPLPAPIGYRNLGKGIKEPDPMQAPLIQRAFELYATGKYSLLTLAEELSAFGLKGRNGGKMKPGGMSHILKNPFYIGLIRLKATGEIFPGSHTPLVSKALFDTVRRILEGKNNDKQHRHFFIFRRLLKCHACGFTLIGELQKGHVYYRCHTKGCPQKCVREEQLEAQFSAFLKQFRFTEAENRYFREWIKTAYHNVLDFKEVQAKALQLSLSHIRERLSRLTDSLIDGTIDKELYLVKKNALLLEEREKQERLQCLDKGEEATLKQVEGFLELANNAYLSYKMAQPAQKRDLVKVVTSNLGVSGKKLIIEPIYPFAVLAKRSQNTDGGPYRDVPRTLEQLIGLICQYFSNPLTASQIEIGAG